jgi:hypothetical protein
MKSKLQTFVFFLFVLTSFGFAQTSKPAPANITVFSEHGDKFTLFVAGIQKNSQPATLVVAKEIRGSSVLLKIVFQNDAIVPIVKTVTHSSAKDVIYAITKDPKGNYFLKVTNKVALPDSAIVVKSIETIKPAEPVAIIAPTVELNKDTVTSKPATLIVTETKPSVTVTPTEVVATKPTPKVMINGQPAQTTITTNSTGTPVLKPENSTGSITIDPSKGYHSPTIGGVPAKDFGDALGDAFDQTFSGKPAPAQSQTTATPPITATTPTINTNTHPAAIGTSIFYSEDGDKFTLTFNGVQANATPLSNVVVSNVSVIRYSVKVVFEDATIAPITKTMMRMGKDCTYAIKKNKKGELVLKLKSAVGAL